MSNPLPPPPVRTAIFDDSGVMTQQWTRWFTSAQSQIQNVNTSNPAYDYLDAISGFSYTFNNTVQTLILDGSGTLSSGQVLTPTNPVDGQLIRISANVNVGSFKLLASGIQSIKGSPTALVAGRVYAYTFRLVNKTWYPT